MRYLSSEECYADKLVEYRLAPSISQKSAIFLVEGVVPKLGDLADPKRFSVHTTDTRIHLMLVCVFKGISSFLSSFQSSIRSGKVRKS